MPRLTYTRDELLADHEYTEQHIVLGHRLHGGFLADGSYNMFVDALSRRPVSAPTSARHRIGLDWMPSMVSERRVALEGNALYLLFYRFIMAFEPERLDSALQKLERARELSGDNVHILRGIGLAHFQYFNVVKNPANAFQPLNCVDFDTTQYLTPADTFVCLTSCHNATTAEGQEGYVVVKATDPSKFNVAWDFDYLVGSEIVINASGATYGLNAIPYCSHVGFKNPTDVSPKNGLCDLDGTEYEQGEDVLIIPSFVALLESQLCLVNLTGDARDLNTVYFSIWNDMEIPLSATLVFNCCAIS